MGKDRDKKDPYYYLTGAENYKSWATNTYMALYAEDVAYTLTDP